MKSLGYYEQMLRTIKNALDEHLDLVLADGVIDYEEAVETRALTDDLAKQVRTLKKELGLDIREMRSEYQLKITNAEPGEKTALRREKVNKLAPYEHSKLMLDKLLLNIGNVKDISLETLEGLEELAKAAAEAPTGGGTNHQDETDDHLIHIGEIKSLEKRWRSLLGSVERILGGNPSPEREIRLKMAQQVLHTVLEDIEQVIEG
jgi:hypothetical protein